jgi:hypothetical protein
MVCLAEDDQENEFKQLNEQIESQNVENINTAIMNCKRFYFNISMRDTKENLIL